MVEILVDLIIKNGFNSEREVICQIYFIPGHGAFKCRNMFDQGFISR